jgi:DNA-binding CsgD family transcriptional regulator
MPATASSPLVGRDEDLARIEAFLSAARDGSATLVFEGEPGIGKTTLWRAGVERARELGFRVLEARPAAAEQSLSFAALADLLAGTHDEIGRLPAPQRRALRIALVLEEVEGVPPDQRAIAASLLGLFRLLGEDTPLAVALDDIQWLDPPSLAALQFALRRLDGEPVRVLATARLGASGISFEDEELIEVGPLPLDVLDRLVRERLGARFLRPTLRQLEVASGGNPFYALEIAASLLRSGVNPEPGEPLPIPASLRELVLDRLATLTPGAREAALATAALAQPTMATVQLVTRDGSAAVSEAVAAGVLERRGDALRFTHPLFAVAIYEELTLGEKRALHRSLAELVDDSEERARHLAEAADGPDEALAAALEEAAASAALRGAADTGAKLAKHAFDLTPPDNRPGAHGRRLEWARLTAKAGDPKQADELLERHLEAAEPGRHRAEVEFELGNVRLTTRGHSAARACYERALKELNGGTEDTELRLRILLELAITHGGELRTGSDVSERAVALAEKLGKPDLLARALALHGMNLSSCAQAPGEEYWRRALEVEQAAGGLRLFGPTHAYAMDALFVGGDFEGGASYLRLVADSMRTRADPMLPWVLQDASDVARAEGAWGVAAEYADEAYDLVVQTGQESLEPQCLLYKARFAMLHGDLELARKQTEEAMALLERLASSEAVWAGWDGPLWEGLAKSLLGRTAAISGRHAEAHEWFTTDLEFIRQLDHPLVRSWLVEALGEDIATLVALGEIEEAGRELAELLEIAEELPTPFAALAARAQGIVVAARGNLAEGSIHLERSLELLEGMQVPWTFELGRTLLALGSVQRRARQKLVARATFERALEIFELLGARLWAEKVRVELSHIGGRPSRPGTLTATEQSIADLVAAGHSNAEVAHELFLSPKTVEWNLSKIYKKLHVRSRTELTAKLAKKAAASR